MRLDGKHVLITRPLHSASFLSKAINAAGGVPVHLPTIEIDYDVDSSGLERVFQSNSHFQLAVFSSKNAVEAVSKWLRSNQCTWPARLKCAVVGTKSAAAAYEAFEIEEIIAPQKKFGAKGLLQLKEIQLLRNIPTVIFEGTGGSSSQTCKLFQQVFSDITSVVVYRRALPKLDIGVINSKLAQRTIDFAVFTSVNGAENLLKIADESNTEQLKQSCCIVYSTRIAEYLKSNGFTKVIISDNSSDDAVIAVLLKESESRTVIA